MSEYRSDAFHFLRLPHSGCIARRASDLNVLKPERLAARRLGFSNGTFLVCAQSAVGWNERGVATASNIFMRQIGQSIGTAAFGAVFNLGIYSRIPNASDTVTRLMNPALRRRLGTGETMRFVDAIARSLHDIYVIVALVALAFLS